MRFIIGTVLAAHKLHPAKPKLNVVKQVQKLARARIGGSLPLATVLPALTLEYQKHQKSQERNTPPKLERTRK